MPAATAWPERLLSEKSGRCGIATVKGRGALPMIDRGDIRQAIDPLPVMSRKLRRAGGVARSVRRKGNN